MKRAFIDANVILRYLTKDPPEMAEAAVKTFMDAKNGKVSLVVANLTVAEVVWVLESFYKYSKNQIAGTLTEFLMCDGLEVESLDVLIEALAVYQEKNLDFADAFLAVCALRKGTPTIYSFDVHLNRVDGITVLKPSA
jgi:predicted nucleic-acid-binding protein